MKVEITRSPTGIVDPSRAEAVGVRVVAIQAVSSGATLDRVAAMIDAGRIRTNVGRVFPLESAGKAQEMGHGREVKGKIVLAIS